MQTNIARAVAFTVCANARLAGAAGWEPDAKLFHFCEFVRFTDLERTSAGWREHPFAEDFAGWTDKLQRAGVAAFRMHNLARDNPHISDRMSVSFVGGGPRWVIESISPDGSDFWEGREQIGDKRAPDRRIWRVTYGRLVKGRPTELSRPSDLGDLVSRMRAVLTEAEAFAAAQQDMDGFADCFRQARATLDGRPALSPYLSLAPKGFLAPEAEALLAAGQLAWVFGGMGSWNDFGFQDAQEQARYERLSNSLFAILNEALPAAANSSAPTTPHPAAPPRRPWWRVW